MPGYDGGIIEGSGHIKMYAGEFDSIENVIHYSRPLTSLFLFITTCPAILQEMLPPALFQLQQLEVLNISINGSLTDIPSEISNLTRLKLLSAHKCNLWSFPKTVALLPNLELLDLSNNRIRSLPENIWSDQPCKLRVLLLNHNRIRKAQINVFDCMAETLEVCVHRVCCAK